MKTLFDAIADAIVDHIRLGMAISADEGFRSVATIKKSLLVSLGELKTVCKEIDRKLDLIK